MLAAWFLWAFLAAPSPPEWINEAVQALENEDYAAAVPLLERALEEDDANVEARFNLAFAYSQVGRDEEAIREYEAVLQQRADLQQALSNLAVLLLRNDRPGEAVSHLESLVQQRPNDFQSRYLLAHALLRAERPEEAAAAYGRALAIDSSSAEAHLERGQALAAAGRLGEAAAEYAAAAALDPELASWQLELAEKLEAGGDRAEALAIYQDYLSEHPEEAAVAERAGLLLLELGREEEALEPLQRAVNVNPTAANQAALAEVYARQESLEKALPLWEQAVLGAPKDVSLRLRYAGGLLQATQFEDSVRQYLEAVKLDPDRVEAWTGLAFAFYKIENLQSALGALREARKRGPVKPASLFLQAIIEDKMQLYEQAKENYEAFLATEAPLEDERWQSEQRLKVIERVLSQR